MKLYTNPACSLAVKIWKSIQMLFPKFKVLYCSPRYFVQNFMRQTHYVARVNAACGRMLANAAFGVPNVHEGDSLYVASKFPVFIGAVFCPCFHVTCINHFSHVLIPNMQNFVPRIPPANPAWSSNQTSEHTSKIDIKFDHISIMDATGPSSKTNDWCHDGIEEFQFVSDGHISAQKNQFVGKKTRLADGKW